MMRRRHDHRCLPKLIAAAILVCTALCTHSAKGDTAASTSRKELRPWMLTAGASWFRHSGITTSSAERASDVALDAGIAHTLGRRIVVEVGGTITTPWDDLGTSSIFVARVQARFYPTIGRSQSDHVFFMLGVMLVACDHEYRGSRTGGGPELGLGADIFVGKSSTLYIQASAIALGLTEGNQSTPGWDVVEPCSTGGFLIRLAAGTRLGL